jgi:CcmD family protein
MTYVLAGYAATVVGLGGYAVWVLRRARSLERVRQEG